MSDDETVYTRKDGKEVEENYYNSRTPEYYSDEVSNNSWKASVLGLTRSRSSCCARYSMLLKTRPLRKESSNAVGVRSS